MRNAQVSVTLQNGEVTWTDTGSLDYYIITDPPAGETYFVSISAKRRRFADPRQAVPPNDDLSGVDSSQKAINFSEN